MLALFFFMAGRGGEPCRINKLPRQVLPTWQINFCQSGIKCVLPYVKLKKIYDYRENTRFTHRCEDFATTSDRGRMDEIKRQFFKRKLDFFWIFDIFLKFR